jgi:hypothetical protein
MPSRHSWPRGLKVLFYLTALELVVGVSQTSYWVFITNEFFPQLTIQGGYAASVLLLSVTSVAMGGLGYRRAFAVTSLVTAAINVGFTNFFNLQILSISLPDILAGRWQPLFLWEGYTPTYAWNSFVISVNALVCYYLLRFEFRLFGLSRP